MQISCPQCATTYELDERVLPAGGAPVQCTRCSHVFTAAPPQSAAPSVPQVPASPPDPEEPAPPARADRTQIYGKRSPGAAAAPQATTQVFGAVAPPEQDPRRTTQMFGAQQVAPPPSDSRRSTQVFGSQQVAPPPADPRRTTQMFGSVPPVAPAQAPLPPIPSSTQIFGAPQPAQQPPPQPIPNTTQIFGAPPPPGVNAGRTTQMFGTPPPAAAAPPPAQPEAPPRSTPMFGSLAVAPPQPESPAPSAPPIGGRKLTGGGVPRVLEPFEPVAFAERAPLEVSDDGFEASLKKGQARRRNAVLALIAVSVVAVGAWFGYQALSGRPPQTPPEAIEAHSAALTQLRRDDAAAMEQAVASLEEIARKWPQYAEGRASHLIALMFRFDDLRVRMERLNAEAADVQKQMKRLEERKEPSDWRNRVNALIDQLTALKKEADPLVEEATALDTRINDAFRAMQKDLAGATGERELHLVRAQAIYFGVKGSDQAVILSERYRTLGGAGAWADLAYAEYALNARVAPDTRRQAREALESVKTQDPSFIRVYVLMGRLALPDKAWDAAVTSFESASTLNPEHAGARALLAHAEKKRSADAEPTAPQAP